MTRIRKVFLGIFLMVFTLGIGVFIFVQVDSQDAGTGKSRPLSMAEKILKYDDDLNAYVEETYDKENANIEEIKKDLYKLKEIYPYFSYASLDEFYKIIMAEYQGEEALPIIYGTSNWNTSASYEDEELNRCVERAAAEATGWVKDRDPEQKRVRKELYYLKKHHPEKSYEELYANIENVHHDVITTEEWYVINHVDMSDELMEYVDGINLRFGGEGTKLYSTAGTKFKKTCMQHGLHLLDASVRHLGTDINYVVLQNLYEKMKDHVDFYFDASVDKVEKTEDGYAVFVGDERYEGTYCIISAGRSGSKWMEKVCENLDITTKSNRVDIGVRVELPAVIFSHLTDELYESKIVYRTEKFEDKVRTFCMNPNGIVVNENTNGIVTVNGHSYEDPAKQTENTNFALLVEKHFSEPFKDSNGYGESIARLSNMLGGGVLVQRFGDLIRGRRSTPARIAESFLTPTLSAEPGDLSLVLPKRILDGIIEMIYALDKIAPGTANDDTLLYGVEVKFYNMEVKLDEHLETKHKGLYVIGDGSGVTHSLSHASASGVFVAREIAEEV